MKEDHFCVRECLAEGCIARVERCACGALHLSVGALTLRFHEPALRSLANTLIESMAVLEDLSDEQTKPLLQAAWGTAVRGKS